MLSACGGGDSSPGQTEATGRYPIEVVAAEFPTKQQLGQTTLLRLAVRNAGERPIPTLIVTMSVGGEEGEGSSYPFTVRDEQPDLAQPDRPVWALSEKYPKLKGATDPAGAGSANQKAFVFGRVEPDETVDAIWKLSAVRTGKFTLLYAIDAGSVGKAKAVTESGTKPGGSFTVRISAATPNTIVTDSGEVVDIGNRRSGKKQE